MYSGAANSQSLARPVGPALARLRAVQVSFLALCLKLFESLIAHGLILRSIVFQVVQPIRFKRFQPLDACLQGTTRSFPAGPSCLWQSGFSLHRPMADFFSGKTGARFLCFEFNPFGHSKHSPLWSTATKPRRSPRARIYPRSFSAWAKAFCVLPSDQHS